MASQRSTTVSRFIAAPPERIYRAFLDAEAVATWLPPGSMRGIIHAFEGREGGAFSMSLVYPDDAASQPGKTSDKTDRFEGRFARLVPDERIVWATVFDSVDKSFSGEMTVTTTLTPVDGGTDVTMVCDNVPSGIRLEDNEEGCRLTLGNLAAFVGG
ncbi:ATPase [Rhizobium leguminosarum bv. trifolii]|uniref:ATPase n=1 Tax=Rhizobium leguminosarum bv. trifolii TaxID=386 RepID=A0A3E1BMB4_RHILT|nr:SRPBCC family protein [Rhizobium leguminosarum]RFB94198.1 ATPase [Rhizobium leguminosarum bv. trifolii]RFB94411.1 ATPase [Rhizobium leguminosarum bv. trifolii]